MTQLLQIQSKIKSRKEIIASAEQWRAEGKKIVFTNGCFDIVHMGHIDYLSKASDLGDVLIIGVNSDASVRKLKGNNRPLQDEKTRASLLSSFFFVTATVIFEEETPYELIQSVQPNVLVKGSDYKEEDIVGADIVKANNGTVETIDFLTGYSTSSIIDKANEAR